jgi:hypothetical protein
VRRGKRSVVFSTQIISFSFVAERINSVRKGITDKFGWLQAVATGRLRRLD